MENIAIIKEIQAHKSVRKAETEALELLKLLSLEDIANKRASQCSELEIFCTMLLRAMMNQRDRIIIVTPFSLITTLIEINEINDILCKLDIKKDIIIVDMQNNGAHYEGDLCNIAE